MMNLASLCFTLVAILVAVVCAIEEGADVATKLQVSAGGDTVTKAKDDLIDTVGYQCVCRSMGSGGTGYVFNGCTLANCGDDECWYQDTSSPDCHERCSGDYCGCIKDNEFKPASETKEANCNGTKMKKCTEADNVGTGVSECGCKMKRWP